MRPAQLTPENGELEGQNATFVDVSMRPAQLTPENADGRLQQNFDRIGFNEAGAINAGKQRNNERNRKLIGECFNEAGAINAGKRPQSLRPPIGLRRGFNEAGAINAGKLTESSGIKRFGSAVSMRPAQLTPENQAGSRHDIRCPGRGFNEAGAINAGKPRRVGTRSAERRWFQ